MIQLYQSVCLAWWNIGLIFVFQAEVTTDSSSKSNTFGSTGVIVGVAAALVLLFALILVALYISNHSRCVSPLYLIQVSNGLSYIYPDISRVLFKLNKHLFIFSHPWISLETQQSLAFLEVSEATAWLLRSGGRSWKRQYCWNWDSLKTRMDNWTGNFLFRRFLQVFLQALPLPWNGRLLFKNKMLQITLQRNNLTLTGDVVFDTFYPLWLY